MSAVGIMKPVVRRLRAGRRAARARRCAAAAAQHDGGDVAEGKVTAIELQRRKSRASIFVEGEFVCGCSVDCIVEFSVRVGTEWSEALCAAIEKKDGEYAAKQAALRYAEYKPRTERQVRDALRKKGWEAGTVEDMVVWLRSFGYLDDERYAREYVEARLKRKPCGRGVMMAELRKKGISDVVIGEVVGAIDWGGDDVLDAAMRFALKKSLRLRGYTGQEWRRKMWQAMAVKGFAREHITVVLDTLERGEV